MKVDPNHFVANEKRLKKRIENACNKKNISYIMIM